MSTLSGHGSRVSPFEMLSPTRPFVSPRNSYIGNVTHPRHMPSLPPLGLSSGRPSFRGSPNMPWLPSTLATPPPARSVSPIRSPTRGRSALAMSYIMPLIDGASGTVPLTHQHPVMSLLKADAPHFLRAVPAILKAFAASIHQRGKAMCWKERRETALYAIVSLIELQLLIFAIPVLLAIPGFISSPFLCAELALLWLLIRLVNNEPRAFTVISDGDEDEREEGWDYQNWTFVGGMDWSEDHLRKATIPRLAKLFDHDMQVFLPYRLGLPFDLLATFFQRTLQLPTSTSTALYSHIRTNCVKNRSKKMNILVHNTGALDVAWVMSRLCSDLPPGQQMGKFNVYTFGAATPELVMPLGSHSGHDGHDCNCEDFPEYPEVNHYTFEDDPFAQIGVLLGARQRMEGRLVGSVYALQNCMSRRGKEWFLRGGSFTMDHYLDALFPGNNPRAGVLGQVCRIERDISEMRELAALAQATQHQTTKGKRLSWTALGALADNPGNFQNDRNEMAGVHSLEETRRIGRASEGMMGYENNSLASHVRGEHRLVRSPVRGLAISMGDDDDMVAGRVQ